MRINRRKKPNLEDEIIQDAEIITKFSLTRIVVAVVLFVVIIGGGILAVKYFINNSKKVLGTANDYSPQIKIPDENRIKRIIDKAKDDLSEVNPKNLVESQPQIQKIIKDLNNISGSSNSARTLICESLCK